MECRNSFQSLQLQTGRWRFSFLESGSSWRESCLAIEPRIREYETMTLGRGTDDTEPNYEDRISSQELGFVEEYGSLSNSAISPSLAELQRLSEIIDKATKLVSSGEYSNLDDLWSAIPNAIQTTIDGDIATSLGRDDLAFALGRVNAALPREIRFEAQLSEVLFTFVEFAVALLSTQAGEHLSQAIGLGTCVPKLLDALSIALDSNRRFYKLRSSGVSEIFVESRRLNSVLQVPGVVIVRVEDLRVYTFCARKGITEGTSVEVCDCCKLPAPTDALLVALSWLFAETSLGSGYVYMLEMLKFPGQHTLSTISLLLQALCQFLSYGTGKSTWRVGTWRVVNCRPEFKDVFINACSEMLKYMKASARLSEPLPSKEALTANQELFSNVLHYLYTVTSWAVSCYGGFSEFDGFRDSIGRVQEAMWERLLDGKCGAVACASIGAAIEATLTSHSGSRKEPLFSQTWLEEKKIISRLMLKVHRYNKTSVPQVIQLLTAIGKKGMIVEENDFLAYIGRFATRPPIPPVTKQQCDASDLIVAHMLDVLNISSYSASFLDNILGWLERFQSNSPISGSRISSILSKLLAHDKQRKRLKRFQKILSKHAAGISNDDFTDFISKAADFYRNQHVIQPSNASFIPTSDQQTNLLQACSSADISTDIFTNMEAALDHKKLYGPTSELWKRKENCAQTLSSSKLAKVLAIDLPFTREEVAKKCSDRVAQAQRLSVESRISSTVTVAAMLPELQTLESLEKEAVTYSTIVQQVEELKKQHLSDYNVMRQEQHKTIEKFFENCRQVKEALIWEPLYDKDKLCHVKRKWICHQMISSRGCLRPLEGLSRRWRASC